MFTKPNCKWCDRAETVLREHVGCYRTLSIKHPSFKAEYAALVPHNRRHHSVPIIFYKHIYVGGYEDLMKKHFSHLSVDA